MTQTLMGALQAAIRAVTGKTFQDFNGDLHDLCDLYAVPAAPISGRVIPVARLFDSTISSASAALNYLLANPTTVVGPTGLFTGGVQGAWYDPSDLTTLFQDSAGTTPVTAVEQAVGLMLDKSKGLVLGSELVTNGDFATDTWWGKDGGVTITGGQCVFTAVANNTGLYRSVFGTQTARYSITYTIGSVTAGGFRWYLNGTSGPIRTAPGTYTDVLNAGTADTVLILRAVGTTTGTIDDVSIKQVTGNHAYQTTSASRPTLRARYNLLRYSEEFDNAAWVKASTGIVANAAVAPDGTTTADKFYPTVSAGRIYQDGFTATNTSVFSVYAKAAEMSVLCLRQPGNAAAGLIYLNLNTGAVTGSGATATAVGNGWYRFVYTHTGTLTDISISPADAVGSTASTPSGTNGILIWGAQITQTAVFPSNTYQRVGAATDYATGAAFPPYLFFDGTDDSMLTNSVDFATVTSDGQARRNLLLNPTQFDASAWGSVGTTVTANAAISPSGLTDAEKLVEDGSTGLHTIGQNPTISSGATYTFSVYVKAAERTWAVVQLFSAIWAYVNLSNGTVGNTSGSPTVSVADAGNGWYRVSVTAAVVSPSASCVVYVASANGTVSYAGTPGSGIFVYGGQLELGSTATAFQNIGTDRMLVVAGVTKSSDAAVAFLCELSASTTLNNGTFRVLAPDGATPSYSALSKGTVAADAQATTGFAAPRTNVVTLLGDISGDSTILRANGAVAASNTGDQGTGNYGNYPLFIGRRNNVSNPLNGNIYSLVIAGAAYSAGQISSTESWVAAKTPLGTI